MSFEFIDQRTPEAKAREERRRAKEAKAAAKAKKAFQEAIAAAQGKGWLPIETCPFAGYGREWGIEGTLLVTDGETRALVSIQKRLGRPVRTVEAPTMAITDHGIMMVGGKYEEIDAPPWWFQWEMIDQLSPESDYGKDEIDFIATQWMPLSNPPTKEPTNG